ncbi:MAG: hypothetical protein KME46_26425 [Brasilonema angustatum HA4187-MV1]|nr:hypothetical protein [Brasilonema angustatum HA4187-MV1]
MSPEQLLQVIEQAAQEQSTELDLSGHNLTALPPEIGKLIHLTTVIACFATSRQSVSSLYCALTCSTPNQTRQNSTESSSPGCG